MARQIKKAAVEQEFCPFSNSGFFLCRKMNKSQDFPQPQNGKSFLEKALDINQSIIKSRHHLCWGLINSVALAVLFYNYVQASDQDNDSLQSSILCKGQLFLMALLAINVLFHFVKYSMITLTLTPVTVSPSQKKLLGVGRSAERWFKTPDKSPSSSPPPVDRTPVQTFTATSPMNLSSSCWLSPPKESTLPGPNYSVGSNSRLAQQSAFMWPASISRSPDEDLIFDELSLSKYLEKAGEFERWTAVNTTVEQPGSSLRSFGYCGSPPTSHESSPMLWRCAYQLSSTSPAQPSTSPGAAPEDTGSPSSSSMNNTELWRRVKVDPSRITQWNANLRMWISLTILERLVKEFDSIDEAFVRCGMSDLHIGSVGLDRLKKTASIPQVVASIPSLPRLVPFLELTPHQEYLVNRIRELAKGGSMSEFRWNSGGFLNGKSWEEHLPTDDSLVMHLIATYFDLQLLPPPHHPDSRPFSSQYLVRSPEKPPRTSIHPIIYQSHLNPPHFVIVDKDEILDVPKVLVCGCRIIDQFQLFVVKTDKTENKTAVRHQLMELLIKGRNNVLYAFLLFLYILKTRDHGMLGPVNLGRSGVNILWVVDS